MKKLTTEQFVEKANLIHGDKYDYSKSEYVGTHSKIVIICPEHGEFKQIPSNHLKGHGCFKCGLKITLNNTTDNKESFIEKANLIHGDRFDYFLVVYKNNHTKVIIICSKHGEFEQKPTHHLDGHSCPSCKNSIGETNVASFLTKQNIIFKREFKFDDCRNLKKLRFDFYLPDYNICIEFNGKQHYIPYDAWGGEKTLKLTQKNDEIKKDYCDKKGIKLIIVKYNENIKNKLTKELEYFTTLT